MGGQLGFLYRQLAFTPQPLPTSVKLDGKTALVTGANIGLGLEAAKELAAHGLARLIISARSMTKGEAAKKEILDQSPHCDVQIWELDYDSFESIQTFGERARMLSRLDIVILSAGVKTLEYTKSRTGHETHVQVNHLGTAALSLFLLAPLKATADANGAPTKLTIVTSEVHFWTPFNERRASSILSALDDPTTFKKGMERYNTSKLLNLLWLRELSSRTPNNVIINGVNPGLCASALHRSDQDVSTFNKIFAWTAEQGGHNLTVAAAQFTDDSGAYISEQVIKKPSPFVLSTEGSQTQARLFDETMALLKTEIPGVDLDSGLSTK